MRTLTTITAAALACGSLLAVGNVAAAQGNSPSDETATEVAPAVAATSTVTLPLLGAPLIVDVSTDAGGGLVDVSLNQADDYTADKIKTNGVAFVSDAGDTQVRVASKWGGERVTASAASLADVSGPGGWSGDIFGTGETTNVAFTVGATADGGPDITGVTIDSAAEAAVGETTYKERTWGDKVHQSATASVEFTQNGQRRTLVITATVAVRGDDTSSDVVIGLSGVRGRAIVEGDPVGTHTWSGALCDGTAASATYTVDAEGAISDVTTTPEADVHVKGDSTWVAFSRHEGVWISTGESRWGDDDSDELSVGAAEWFKCDRVDPTVNTEIDPDALDNDGHHGDWKGDWNDGQHGDWTGDWKDGQRGDQHGNWKDDQNGDRKDHDQNDRGDWDDSGDWGDSDRGDRGGDRRDGDHNDDDGGRDGRGDDGGRDGRGD